ncbi:T9SS type B sorting domain-containing protein [Formosa sp. A9]|uniref:T9SS type B sorting domain-containing protein n=1 Tax=Formosa sp. A9 TaxID=3442641 RepID=UPI003EC01A40
MLYYRFNGDTNDSSSNGNHGDNFGGTFINDRFGNSDSAIYFDGINDYVNFPNIQELKPDLPVSFSFWIRYDSNSSEDREVFNTSFEEDRNTGVFFNSQASTGNYAVNYGDGSYSYVSSTRRSYVTNSAIDVNNWHQIIVIVNSANDMRIYFDCIENGGSYSGSGGELQYSDLPGCIGRHDRTLGVPANYFKGAIDDFRYWDRALTDENIAELLSSTLISSIAFTNLTECGLNDGSIVISNLEFNTNYTITYDYLGETVTHNLQSDDSGVIEIIGLPEGVYDAIMIIDNNTGCSSDLGQVELLSPDLEATITSINPTDCSSNDGVIAIGGLSVNMEYTVSYNDGTSQSVTIFSDSNGEIVLTGLPSGLYGSITVEEVGADCSDDLGQVELLSPDLEATITSINPTDCSSNDGVIAIGGLSVNMEYTVSYNDGTSQSVTIFSDSNGEIVLTGLPSGLYGSITVEEVGADCSDDLGQVELLSPDLEATITSINPTDCSSNDGVIAIGGLSVNMEYTVSYNDGTSQSVTIFSDSNGEIVLTGLPSGLYGSITVEEVGADCSDDLGQVELLSPDLEATITSINPTDCSSNDGVIAIGGLSVNMEYTVSYNDGTSQSVTIFSDSNGEIVLTGLPSGLYGSITVEEVGADCSDDLGQVELLSPDLEATITSINPTDCSSNDGVIAIGGLSVNMEYTVSYNDGTSQSVTIFSDSNGEIVLTGLPSGLYGSITVEEVGTGCSDDLGQVELLSPDLEATITSINPTDCSSNDGVIAIGGLSVNMEYTVSYNDGTSQSVTIFSDSNGEIVLTGLPSGLYGSITVEEVGTGCSDDLGQVELLSPDLEATITSINPTDCSSNDGVIAIGGLSVNMEYTVSYNDGTSQSVTIFSDSNGEIVLTGLPSGLYGSITVEEVGTGCSDDLGQVDLNCINENTLCFKTKKFFTPNNDGYNDFWNLEVISNNCVYTLYIFDRYGKLLKTLTPENDKWDGTYRGVDMPSNDYWYLIMYFDGLNNQHYTSHFALKR